MKFVFEKRKTCRVWHSKIVQIDDSLSSDLQLEERDLNIG
jgi:hypothetical protein